MIRDLAQDLDAIKFEPHLTVFCGQSSDAEAEATAREIAAKFPPIVMHAVHLDHSDRFTKTLFVQFKESAPARAMSDAARRSFARPSDYVFNPHLSLLYKRLPEAQQAELCQTLDVPMGTYTFDRIRMIETELPIEDSGPIRRWRRVCDFALSGP